MKTYKRLLSYIKPYRGRLALAVFFMFCYTVFHSLVSVVVFLVINGIQNKDYVAVNRMPDLGWLDRFNIPQPDFSSFQLSTSWIPWIVIVVFLLRGLFDYISRYQMASVGLRAIRKVRDDLYAHLVRLSMNFYSKGRTGELMSRTMHDVGMIQGGITDVIVDLVKQPLTIAFQIVLLFFWGGPLAAVALVVFSTVLLPLGFLGRKLRTTERKSQEQVANINSEMQETFSGISVVKAFNMERYEVNRFWTINKRVFELLKRSVVIIALQRPLIEVLGAVGIAFAIWYGISMLPLDRFASFLTTLFLFYEPLKKLSKVYATIQQSIAAGTRIFELMDEVPSVTNRPGAVPLGRAIDAIRFRSVSLAYEPGKNVLSEVDFTVRAGEIVAIVGTSGAGKTSLVNLLPRFYDPTAGSAEVNGRDIRNYEIHSLRERIGIVNQETFLFNATVFENIAYGQTETSFEGVEAAARAAFAEDFIDRMPNGYDTVIGERGVRLSGGQRQRISIARAVLKNPPILILDEATSQLDTESERKVQQALELLMEGRTVFVIAHRLSTVHHADRIIVLDRGRLVQSGTNASLLREGGVYKRLYELQFNV